MKRHLLSALTFVFTATTAFCDVAVYNGSHVGTTVRTDANGSLKSTVNERVVRILDLSQANSQMAQFAFFTSSTGQKYYAYHGIFPHLFTHVGGPGAGGSKTSITRVVDKVFPSGITWHTSARFQGADSLVKVSDVSTISLARVLKGTSYYLDYTPTETVSVTRISDYAEVARLDLILTQKFNNQQLSFQQAIEAMKTELNALGYLED